MRLRLAPVAPLLCRTVGHYRVPLINKQGAPVAFACARCKVEWPLPTVKEALHRDRRDMGYDCVTLSDCTDGQHTNEWPCDFA